MDEIKRFYYREENRDILKFDRGADVLPIIWNRSGQYTLIPIARIENELDITTVDPVIFKWYLTGHISLVTARLLLDGQE